MLAFTDNLRYNLSQDQEPGKGNSNNVNVDLLFYNLQSVTYLIISNNLSH